MITAAVWILLSTALSQNTSGRTDLSQPNKSPLLLLPPAWNDTTSSHEPDLSLEIFRQRNQDRYAGRHLLFANQQRQTHNGKVVVQPDKKTKVKNCLDNNTGLRKPKLRRNCASPTATGVEAPLSPPNVYVNSQKLSQDQSKSEVSADSFNFHQINSRQDKILSDPQDMFTGGVTNAYNILDHDSNRPSKINQQRTGEGFRNYTKQSWITNRHPSSLLYQFSPFKKGSESKEKICLNECHKEKDERDSYCNSDFAVNGIVHNVETLSKGTHLLTLLVNSAGLYKMNRLYITPDGFFFRIKILAVDTLRCHKPCLDFKLGKQIFFKNRTETAVSI
ncbi:UPF0450 C17orf58 homolog isoform X1 [Pelobates cultripes]|uniref:UPF0450 C17orf58 homolog isoform X1 n=1 Tax=Pelobates cultripes TaxID=61616 RepID=A0AAD1S622_PELCU|nr:UPF0450 C17orf58 homolog isoform X1 [Pelobates cultripes]